MFLITLYHIIFIYINKYYHIIYCITCYSIELSRKTRQAFYRRSISLNKKASDADWLKRR